MKYLTKDHLLKIRSYESGAFSFNRSLTDRYLAKLSPDARLPVKMIHPQESVGLYKDVMRVDIEVPLDGKATDEIWETAFVDMPIEDYNALPEMD